MAELILKCCYFDSFSNENWLFWYSLITCTFL